jgi:1-aminocyclopropane-1-carboxylate deaminase
VSGNKFRKLKYNLLQARRRKGNTHFWRGYSNHIAAVAFAGKEMDSKPLGLFREDAR